MHPKLRGDYGEKLAAAFLKNKKYKILARNFRMRGGELDIVALSPVGILVFTEVKVRTSYSFGHGDESIGRMKIHRMQRAIERYLCIRPNKEISRDPDYRIDVIEINMCDKNIPAKINHLEDIEI